MKLYTEMKAAIGDTADGLEETDEFRRRFKKMIENYFSETCSLSDIENVINLSISAEDEHCE